jgi:hypothetical protein
MGDDVGIAIVIGQITVTVRRGFDRAPLREVVQALAEPR